ncbi:MAG: hypothetical protein CR991_11725 [Proteobacteria bacterium]|nr:MAG: hypothetical protein CR991_11725 [Pseudomonadota bacterium]
MHTPRTKSHWTRLLATTLIVLGGLISGCGSDKSVTISSNLAAISGSNLAAQSSNKLDAKVTTQQKALQLSELLSQFPKGQVGRNTPLILTFRRAIVPTEQVNSTLENVLSLKGAISGKTRVDSSHQLVFEPDEPLASGQSYTLTLNPQGLLNIPADTGTLSFPFQTPNMEIEVKTQGLSPQADSTQAMQLQGTLYTSDYAAADAIAKVLTAKVQQQNLPLTWEHNLTGTEHRFSITNIPRETFATDLVLSWNGSIINAKGINSTGKMELPVPSQETFRVTRIQTERSNENSKPYIAITFSDPLDHRQDITGLVQLGTNKIRTQIVGNRLLVYPSDDIQAGTHTLVISAGVRADNERLGKLPERFEQKIQLEAPKPEIRFVGRGSILPDGQYLEIPFEAQAVNAVQVTAFEIYPDNLQQFLQVNTLNGDYETERVGRYLWRKTIPLNSANPNQWNRYTLDASQLLKTKPGTLYRLELAVDRRHSTYTCPAGTPKPPKINEPTLQNYEDTDTREASGWDGISDYYANTSNSDDLNFEYDWEQRENPCNDNYYYYQSNKVTSAHNFIASNIGLLAKREANGRVNVIVTDLRNAQPLDSTALEIQNFQGQVLAKATTDARGFASLNLDKATPFLLIARKDGDIGYLKLNANAALAISQFDVGGETVQQGLKGYLYGERGVWRPGDNIYMSFVLQDRANTLPEKHPVTLQLIDPTGKVKQVITNKDPVGPFYTFTLNTDENDPTGDWLVKARLGGNTFNKTIKIETVRPNRLKVELDYDVPALYGYKDLPEASLFGQWLHGGTASHLKADVIVRLREKTTKFGRLNDYVFDDPARSLDSEAQQLVEGRLDAEGYLRFQKNFQPQQPAPGILSAWFTSRVYEEGGGFSTAKQSIDYYPFENYVGIKLPKGDAERGMLLTDVDHTVEIASLNAEGQEVSLPQVEVTLYKIDWKWWWDKTPDSLAEYADADHSSQLQQAIISTENGRGTWQFQIKYPDWGRYFVRACDLQGKHCTGKTVYIDWPGWAGRAQEEGSGAASMLRFSSDKESYQVGETAQIQLPEAPAGRALMTLETSSRILEYRWINLGEERTQTEIPITAAMTPNVYVSITLIQPHQGKQNDRPIRLYGIIPLKVENPATRLNPVINAPEEWQPEGQQTFTVSEQSGKAMNYTVAVIDEGLLGLTRFKTPDLHAALYRKEALGIKTWDLFDDVIGAYGGKLERMLALGGGDEVQIDDDANKPKRFPPVVRFLGAFHLEAGQSREHTVELPTYLGAVRIMVVAAEDNAYGKAEQSVFVRKPLMLLSSLPRTLKTNESVAVPLTVFVGSDEVKQVEIQAEANAAFAKVGAPITLDFTAPGEKLATLAIQAGAQAMQGKLRFTASSGDLSSSHAVDIAIQPPNLPSVRTLSAEIPANGDWSQQIQPYGLAGSNQTTLELAALPNLKLEQRLDYLLNYPHGCLEQTTSTVFPQLYLPKLMQLDTERQQKVEKHVKAAIQKLNAFQAASGDLMYWPGSNEANEWASIYAGHFLLEAQKQGYNVPISLLSGWLAYQYNQAQQWTAAMQQGDLSQIQAYRLYVLALAGKPQLGAMNRLRESGRANPQARWLLAAAYQHAGQAQAAADTTRGLVATQTIAPNPDISFSNRLGILGIQLQSIMALEKPQDAELLVKQIAEELGKDEQGYRFNTHDIAWSLMAVAHYLQNQGEPIAVQISLDDGAATALKGGQSVLEKLLAVGDQTFKLALHNDTQHTLYANVSQRGIAPVGDEVATANGLTVQAILEDSAGEVVWDFAQAPALSPLLLEQGEDYVLKITVHNESGRDLKHLAFSSVVPSGMEIGEPANAAKADLNYQDVRDDRVLSYFDLENTDSKQLIIPLNAAFLGDFYFPGTHGEAMYAPDIRGNTVGFMVQIVKNLPDGANTNTSEVATETAEPVEATTEAAEPVEAAVEASTETVNEEEAVENE